MGYNSRFPRWRWNSLFNKLLLSFLVIILLLLSFNMLSFTFFKTNIQREIIKHNTLGLEKTVDGYERHFSLIQNDILQFSFNETLSAMAKSGAVYDYGAVDIILKQIQSKTNNSFLYMENFVVYMPNQNYMIEKNGTSESRDLFINNFMSDEYSKKFWEDQLKERFAYRVFPAVPFRKTSNTGLTTELGTLFPIVSKGGSGGNSFLLLSLIKSKDMFERFHFPANDKFLILDESDHVLFSEGEPAHASMTMFPGTEGFIIKDEFYYFYKKGLQTGFMYVTLIPHAEIASQISRLNAILLTLLAAAVLIGILVSIFLSYKFNNPIQRLIESMRDSGRPAGIRSGIHEWNWIQETMTDMVQSKQEMSTDLTHKANLLKQYGYLRGAKSLYPIGSLGEQIENEKPFYMLVFQLVFTKSYRELTGETQEKACYYIQQFINLKIADQFEDTMTLQTEKNQILSLVFDTAGPDKLHDILTKLKEVFDRDKEYCQLTVAFIPEPIEASGLAAGYEKCKQMLLQRSMTHEMQIVTELEPYEKDPQLYLPALQEKELIAQLHAGESERSVQIVNRMLRQMEQKGMNAQQFRLFGREVASHMIKALLAQHIDVGALMESHSPYEKIAECGNVRELESILQEGIEETCRLIREKKESHDPVKQFLLDYIEKHYNEDISLETAAEMLQRSRSYLSTYLKEKTGMTFIDYVHDIRIRKAKQMLGEKDVRINEISELIGYQNVNSFIRMFKKICGVTPGEYRRSLIHDPENTIDRKE